MVVAGAASGASVRDFPCCALFLLQRVLPPLPRWDPELHLSLSSLGATAFPVIMAGRLPQRPFRGLLGVHCTLRPAWSADPHEGPFLKVLQTICHLLIRFEGFRLERPSPAGLLTPVEESAFHGAHNNHAERLLRRIALARRSSMFVGHDASGQRYAINMSLVASCRLNGIHPTAFLSDGLPRIADHPAKRIAELLPDQWVPAS